MSTQLLRVNALEFDLDGTIVDSTEAIEKSWADLLATYPHLNEDGDFFHKAHGVRVSDVFRKYLSDKFESEQALIDGAYDFDRLVSVTYGKLNYPIKGAGDLFKELHKLPGKPFCIVTSGSSVLAHGHFQNVLHEAGVEKPDIFIVAEDVSVGKPDPEGYKRGARLLSERLGYPIEKVVVFEDAPAGIKAGLASGATVVGIASTFDADKLYENGANYVIQDLSKVKVKSFKDRVVELELEVIERKN
ncbi:hypothetical protein KL921_002698 [Ogataea angusta]|uniref:2-deoxyglucose-6-phosphate phosphatase n=1 Tax=Pichia angusta TaxID=870730 RepID=A0AAN6DHE0_PICAN|nr:uncharacterized protein KL928_001590 [Ogataea angusta]KAG7811070.1 hypothetical protein KL921_002698 [Ogataea angusta]KAG7820153.1 hypothetical protein KL928_001590 [Ogataea angusta]KAG7823835.1 hypothetical protein KL909_002572 [Ogataea angusta]KAG7829525.1 hypothetical protein KL920_002384 [Ogataea angusta]KAG7838388.1 hypothetical protein KL943_000464 [Ogataea angusta]